MKQDYSELTNVEVPIVQSIGEMYNECDLVFINKDNSVVIVSILDNEMHETEFKNNFNDWVETVWRTKDLFLRVYTDITNEKAGQAIIKDYPDVVKIYV